MKEALQKIVAGLGQRFSDGRTQLFDVQVETAGEDRLQLTGRVLDAATLDELHTALAKAELGSQVDSSQVKVLRQPQPQYLWVATNLTSLHNGTSFLAEMSSQLLYGWRVEVLEEDNNWVFVRQDDGYLGWTYRPYLTDQPVPQPTHLVVAPVSQMWARSEAGSPVLTRLLSGTAVAVTGRQGEWAEVQANQCGWVPVSTLRARADLPKSDADRRQVMVKDGHAMTGVPYLWGGISANGIDCSGLAQLLHRWVGITLPRDADMQYLAGTPIEPPFQPGDLIFFGEPGESRNITHVAISLGGWNILHSSRSRNGVYVDDVQAVEHLHRSFYGACTYINNR